MNNKISYQEAVQRLEETSIPYKVLNLDDNFRVVISSRGGRVFGPFDGDGESILWMNAAFKSNKRFIHFLENNEVHLGGERMWIGPELEFYCDAPELFDTTYTIQPTMDPGNFIISGVENEGVRVEQDVEMNILRNGSGKSKTCHFSRTFYSAASPLTYIRQLKDINVRYCGFYQDVYLRDTMPEQKMYLEPWLIAQINPGGRVVVPFLGDFEFDNYYEPVDESVQKVGDGYVELNTNGCRKYKTAYKSANTFGRMGYVNRLDNGQYYLMIRNYYNDPSIPYCSEPWGNLGVRGASMYFYNDDQSNGGFAEFENSCAMTGLDSKRSESYSTTSMWFFFGEKEELEKIMRVLLGVNYTITN